MKVAVSAAGDDLSAQVDPRFGRCQYFLIVDTDSNEYEAVPNEGAMASGGAGIQAAQTVGGKGAEVVITGNVGPNAYRTLTSAGIKILVGATGEVKDVIDMYKKGELKEAISPTAGGHHRRAGAFGGMA